MVRHQVRRALAAAAALLGVLAAVPAAPSLDVAALAGEIEREADHVTAIELAEWIRARRPGLRVMDVRTDSEYVAYHIPSAEHAPLAEIARMRPAGGETLVLYSEGGAHAAQAWVLLRALGFRDVYFLRGGLLDWTEDVMNPTVATDSASERVAALSRYFGGVPRLGDVPSAVPLPTPNATRDATADAVARIRRRGC